MRDVAKGEIPPESVQRMVQGIPFFNEIIRTDAQQLDAIMTRSRLLQADPGDVVIRRGDSDPYLYFLLKGQLDVLAGEPGSTVINTISPGQPFGTLAMLRSMPRSATIVSDPKGKASVLLAVDYNLFRDVDDASLFTLGTRLAFYRMIVNDIRWTLEMNKKSDPGNALVANMRKLPLFTGGRGTRDELLSLREQANGLAEILCAWNESSPKR
jgi:CRP/FNR family cyclic AMP-dependent transcriptional regulator